MLSGYNATMQNSDLQKILDDTKGIIDAYSAAILFLATNPTLSYSLDTGQSIQKVTRANLAELRSARSALLNECAMLEARLNGGSISITGPAF